MFFVSRDLSGVLTRTDLDSILRLEDVIKSAPQKISVVEASAREGTGLGEIARWIQQESTKQSS